jgi:hypothetical protein
MEDALVRRRSMAAAVSADPAPALCGTRRATALPWRVITTSSPLSTRSRRCPSLFLASKAPIEVVSGKVMIEGPKRLVTIESYGSAELLKANSIAKSLAPCTIDMIRIGLGCHS